MKRPETVKFSYPKSLREIPLPIADAGVLIDINAGFRSSRPVIHNDLCVNCMICYAVCPDGTIYVDDGKMCVDYDFCKGCGICAHECRKNAIEMVSEEEADE